MSDDGPTIIEAGSPIIEEMIDEPTNPKVNIPSLKKAMMSQEDKLIKLALINKMLITPLSTNDIGKMLNGQCKILNSYEEIDKYATLEELISPYACVVILFPNYGHKEIGHWVTLFSPPSGQTLEYFDSYGAMIDQKIDAYDAASEADAGRKAKRSHQPQIIRPQLIKLILESPYVNSTNWNDVPYQSERFNFATCGFWCCCRLMNKHLTEDQFRENFYTYPDSQGIEPDAAMCLYMYNKFNK